MSDELNINKGPLVAKLPELLAQIHMMKAGTEYSRNSNIKRFADSWYYYRGQRPIKESWESSDYVEPVLRESVDQIRPSLLNVFTENDEQAVIFRPQSSKINKAVVEAVNKKINDIFLRENEGKRMMGDVFVEGLVTGDTFMKFFIEEEIDEVPFSIDDWLPAQAIEMMLEPFPDTDITKLETKTKKIDGQPVVFYKGKLTLKKINKFPRLEHVSAGDLFVDDTCGVNIKDARYIGHRVIVTVGDALEMGFDEDLILGASTFDVLNEIPMSTKRLVVDMTLSNPADREVISCDPMTRKIVLWDNYLYSSIPDKKGKVKLYQVMSTDTAILSVTEVSRMPFVHGVPESIPGSFWGGSMFDRTKALQDNISKYERLRHQNAINGAHGRYYAVKGAYDRQSLLANRPGGVVEVGEVGAVGMLTTSQLPPSLDMTLAQLRQTKNEQISTSVGSALAGGSMNGIAASTVAMTIANEELKDKVIAKSFAWTLIKPLFELIYETIRDENYELVLDITEEEAAQGVPAVYSGAALPVRADFTIDVNTSNDDSVQANNLTAIVSTFAQISQMPVPIITEQNAFNIVETLCKLNGIANVDDYFSDPAKRPEPTEEELMAQQEQAAMEQGQLQAQNDLLTAQVQGAAAQLVKTEKEIEELLKDGQSKRDATAEDTRIAYEKLALERMKVEILYNKYKLDETAVEAEILLTAETGQNVSISGAR